MTYLNTAAEGIPSAGVEQALLTYFNDKRLGMDGRVLHEEHWNAAREGAATMLGLSTDEIGLCSCSSEAYNLAAMALQLRDGDEVIINDLDFPAGATPWLQSTCPAATKLWRSRNGRLAVDDLIPLLSSKTRLVTVSLVSFYNGFMVPLPPVIDAIRKHSDALLAVDVTQALGRVPLSLDGVDLIVSSTHKWILGPHGGGIVGVPAHRANKWTVPAGGWFNLENAFDADRFERAISKPGAASFSVGMPNFPAVYALNAALAYINTIGVEAIHRHAQPLVHACMRELRQLPVELITPDEDETLAGIIAFRHPRADAIHQRLHEQRIHVMHHAGRLRIAIHGYNTANDIERFIGTLKEALDHV